MKVPGAAGAVWKNPVGTTSETTKAPAAMPVKAKLPEASVVAVVTWPLELVRRIVTPESPGSLPSRVPFPFRSLNFVPETAAPSAAVSEQVPYRVARREVSVTGSFRAPAVAVCWKPRGHGLRKRVGADGTSEKLKVPPRQSRSAHGRRHPAGELPAATGVSVSDARLPVSPSSSAPFPLRSLNFDPEISAHDARKLPKTLFMDAHRDDVTAMVPVGGCGLREADGHDLRKHVAAGRHFGEEEVAGRVRRDRARRPSGCGGQADGDVGHARLAGVALAVGIQVFELQTADCVGDQAVAEVQAADVLVAELDEVTTVARDHSR